MVFARVVALEATCLRSTVPSVFDSSLVRLPVAVARPGRSAWEKSDAKAVARRELPPTWPSPPPLGALESTEPSDPSSGLEPFWIEQ